MVHPLQVYGAGLLAAGEREGSGSVTLRGSDGTLLPLALERYLGAADETDRSLLAEVTGPVLDVGCGPGRHLHALAQRGVFALGVDLSPVAVELARGRGARAIVGSVFDELPGAGTWATALLLDGNIGIGGEPVRLLRRLARLLRADGRVIVELEPAGTRSGYRRVRLESDGQTSSWFPWARIACDEIAGTAVQAGFEVGASWRAGERWFAALRRSPAG